MDWNLNYEITPTYQFMQNGITYHYQKVEWFNLREEEEYVMIHQTILRVGKFHSFKWIPQYKEWMSTFINVHTY